MKKVFSSILFLCALFSSATLYAQEVTGSYTLSISQNPGASDCVWAGDLDLIQSGGNPGTFTGTAAVTIVSGPCPGFSGEVSGTISGSALEIGVAVSGLGNATFSGTVTGPNDLEGTWSGLGITGIWSAVRVASVPDSVTAIPTLPQWALLLLIALIAGFALRYSSRRTMQ
tara:strand:+ start:124248 stop:124760 length:513 start_codon:yes stop_codon:yes gene_type:complete